MSGCRQQHRSPRGDRSGAEPTGPLGRLSRAITSFVLLHVERLTCGYALPSVELNERDFRLVERRPGELPTGSCIESCRGMASVLIEESIREIDALDDGPATSRSARWIRSEARMPDFRRNVEGGRPSATLPQWPRINRSWAAV